MTEADVCVFYKAKSVFEICSSRQTPDSCSFWKRFQYLLSLFSVILDLDPNLSIPDPAHVSHRFHCVVAIDRVGYPDVGSLWPSGAPTSSSSSSPPPACSDPSTFSTVWVSSAAAPANSIYHVEFHYNVALKPNIARKRTSDKSICSLSPS